MSILYTRGSDFRTAFCKLGGLRAFTDAPFMALTASAPPDVQTTITECLNLNNPVIVSRSLDRHNISLSATPLKNLNVGIPILTISDLQLC